MNLEPNITSTKKNAAIYARVSSTKQQEDGTIESQINALVELSEKHNLNIPEEWVFQDNGISGSTIQRPALDTLRDLVASGSLDIILIYHPDRLARKYVYQAILLEEFSKNGVEVIFYKNKKAETPEEHLLEQFQGVFAEYERAQITERCRRGKLYKAKQGSVSVVPNAPYGYRYIVDEVSGLARYEPDKEESETVLQLFKMYGLEGKNFGELCSYLDQNGKKPRKSSLGWDKSTLRKMLKNRAYTGLTGYCKTEKVEGDSKRIVRGPKCGRVPKAKNARKARPEDEWLTIPVPAIVDSNLFEIVQDKLFESSRLASRNTKNPSILQGVVVCGMCGASYYKKTRPNSSYYICHKSSGKYKTCNNRSINQKDLDKYVWSWLTEILNNPELILTELARRAEEDGDKKQINERKVNLEKEQKKIVASRNKLLDAYTEGDCLSLEELKKRMQTLNHYTKQIERELGIIEAKSSNENEIKLGEITLRKFAESLAKSSEELSIEDQQRVVRFLIHEIVINEDSINIRHCIPIEPDKRSGKCPLEGQRCAKAPPEAKER